MSSRAVLAVLAGLAAACHGRTAPARDRVLARIPADAQIVVAADGPPLAGLRGAIDVLGARWPQRFGCVIDAAMASDHAALGIGEAGDLVVAIDTRAKVACAGLSQLPDGLWVATLGAARPADAGSGRDGGSVIDGAAHATARRYLETAPVAVSIALPEATVIATASSAPLEAWLAIDTPQPSAVIERKVRAIVDRMAHTDATAAFARAIEISHGETQVVVKLAGPVGADLATAVKTVAGWFTAPAAAPAPAFGCPALAPPIVGCRGGTALEVTQLPEAVAPLAAAAVTPVVVDERVAALQLDAPVAPLGLEKGDRVIAVGGRKVTSAAQLVDALRGATGATTITVQRDAVTVTLELAEPKRR